MPRTALIVLLALFAQLLSGAAAIVNQTVWQRSLIVYLAGSEAVSSMIVILAFMAGLGAGALWIGRTAHRIGDPARALASVELLLGAANLVVLGLLSLDVGDALHRFQRLAFSFGVPQRLVYAVVSCAVLLGPCFLMGVTSPLMSEVAQRQLRLRDSRFLAVIFFANTLGAFGGGLATGFFLMPLLGQRNCLGIAIAFNVATGILLLYVSRQCSAAAEPPRPERAAAVSSSLPRRIDLLGFVLGFLALGYEMYLYRVVAISFEPKPYTFATVLCLYLLFWSVGVLLARWMPWSLALTLALTCLSIAPVPTLASLPWDLSRGPWQALLAAGFWLPCLGFGAAFGQLVIRVAVRWGNDVGRFYGWNTIGSCLGILVGVLVGYEVNSTYPLVVIASGYLLLALEEARRETGPRRPALLAAVAVAVGMWVSQIGVLAMEREETASGFRTYYGREGVVEVRGGRAMFWNGLGHGTMSSEGDHVGNHDWFQAAFPLLAHAGTERKDALVVGLGTGITAGTLASSSTVSAVDVYEINPTLKRLLQDFPAGTLYVGENPKVRLLWQDGRTGLAISDQRYDVITQAAPLYLKQAGSSMLLSREYLQLVRSRLKPGGVCSIYSNAQGHPGQALLIRRTAREVFRHAESFGRGYLVVASDSPFTFDAPSIERALAAAGQGDAFAAQVRAFGVARLAGFLDQPRLEWGGGRTIVTDDHPLVEYPAMADEVVARERSRPAELPR